MRLSPSVVAFLVLGAALSTPGFGQQRSFGEATTVVAVEVPVQVLIDGKPVRGLVAADFELLDGRKTQKLTGFEVVDLAELPRAARIAATPAVSPSGRRYFLLLLDLSFSEPSAILRARLAAKELVRTALHPSDLVAVGTYRGGVGPRLLINFTTDRRQIDLALDTLGLPELVDRSPDVLGLILREQEASVTTGGQPGRGGDAQAVRDEAVLENLREIADQERQAERQSQIQRVTAMTRAMADLGRLMANVKGRKYVVYLSEGFDSRLLTGAEDPSRQQELSEAAQSGEIWKVDSTERFGDTRTLNQLDAMIEEFKRADCVIQAVDIGGLRAGADQRPRASGRETLFNMARSTGGQFYENFNNLAQAMGQMLEATSVTYILTFQPENLRQDGKFRPIKVRLANGPKGATVVARPGYYAPVPFEERKGLERQLDSAELLLAGEPGGAIATEAVLVPFKMQAGLAYVPVVVEVAGADLLAGAGKEPAALEVFAYAVDVAGGIRDFLAQSLQLDFAKVGERLRSGNLKVAGSLFLPPGEYAVRLLVRKGASGAYGLRSIPLSVPEFAGASAFAGPPLFPSPMTAGLVVRAAARGERPKEPMFPFVLGREEFYLPSAMPKVPAGGGTRLAWMAYGLAAGDLKLEGQVLGSDGREVPGASFRLLDRARFDQPGLERLTIDFTAPRLAPGTYQLRLSVTDPAGVATAGVTSFAVGP